MYQQPYSHNQDNASVAWAKDWRSWPVYAVSILGLRYLLDILSFSSMPLGLGWTIIHLLHAIVRFCIFFMFIELQVTFYLLHWAKGSAFYTDRKDVAKLTLWEQIDGERAFTPTKKFLTIIVVALFIVTWHQNEYLMDAPNIFNWAAFIVLIVAKLPIVHRVRFFGINSD